MSTLPGTEGPMTLITDAEAEVLAAVVDEVPYSSTSQFHEYFGETPVPASFGVSCAFQSFEVGRRLAANGGPMVSYLVDGRHVAAVVRVEDGLDVLDPYLMHREPIRLRTEDARAGGSVVASVPALPIRRAENGTLRPGRVRAVWNPGRGRLRLEYTRFKPSTDGYAVSRVFTLDTEKELRAVPPPADVVRPLLLHPEQNNLSIRVVDAETLAVREIVFPLTGGARHRAPSKDGLLVRDNQGAVKAFGAPGFDAVLGDLARSLGSTAGDVVDFVLGGARIYRRVAPPDLELPEYQAVDE
jgi:hypothetical protein